VDEDWRLSLIYDFGGSTDATPASGIEIASIGYTGFKPATIELGYMDVLYTLEESTSSNDIMLMERAAPVNVATNIAAGDFRSAFGVRANTDGCGVASTSPARSPARRMPAATAHRSAARRGSPTRHYRATPTRCM